MKSTDVLARLQSLPLTFQRNGPTYAALQGAIVATTSRYTVASDDTSAQMNIDDAGYRWLDTFGLMYGVPRFDGELSDAYLARIKATLVAWRGTPVAIEFYLELITGLGVSVAESPTTYSWSATLSGAVTSTLQTRVNSGVNFVRPAGVPFSYAVPTGGNYASTLNYLGYGRLTGSYILSGSKVIAANISANTNNALPALPTDYLTDTSLNA